MPRASSQYRSVLIAFTWAALACAADAQVIELGDDGVAHRVGGGWTVEPHASMSQLASPFSGAVEAAAKTYDLSPHLLDAVARSESGYNARAVSPAGAIGVMQLMPATAKALGVDPRDPVQNIMGGARYLRAQLDRFGGSIDLALAAYNAGPGRVAQYGGVPPFSETQAYVATNLDRLAVSAGSAR